MHKSYYQMVDAVNEATTERDHAYAEARLSGWIECAEYHRLHWSGISADQYTEHKYGDRPMCCGVLLDWMPNVQDQRGDGIAGDSAGSQG